VTLVVHELGPRSTAPPLVCLHGVTGHGRHFASLAARLERSVLAPDLRGHGDSNWEPPWNLEQQVLDLLESIPEGRLPWLGHSWGGKIAHELAVAASDRVDRLVLLDPATWVRPHAALFGAENARRERAYESFDEAVTRRYDESSLVAAPRELVEGELRGHLVPGDDGLWRYRYCQSAVVAAYGEMAREPTTFPRVPTLVVLGEQSYLPYDDLLDPHRTALGDLLQVARVPGSHTVLWDALEETADLVGEFLAA
jgi:lipase